jgi:hypothetical protein
MGNKVEIKIEVTSCKQCPFFKITGVSSTDGFDRGEDWHCQKSDKLIDSFVEWHEEKNIIIPNWCHFKN